MIQWIRMLIQKKKILSYEYFTPRAHLVQPGLREGGNVLAGEVLDNHCPPNQTQETKHGKEQNE
jgi:hypothetical protein